MKTRSTISIIGLLSFLGVLFLAGCLPAAMQPVGESPSGALEPEPVIKGLSREQPVITLFSDSKGNVQFFSEVNDEFSENQPLGRFSVSPGEVIDFEVSVEYDGPLFYKYGYTAIETEESPYILLADWNEDSALTWQIPDDIPLDVTIVVIVQVKNDDGIEEAGNSVIGFYDDSAVLTYKAR